MDDLATIAPLWRDFEARAAATVFQAFDTFQAWARHIAPARGAQWCVAAVREGASGHLVMLLPLMVHRAGRLTVVEGADLEVSDFFAPAIARDFSPSQSEMRSIIALLRRLLPPADLLRLAKLPATLGAKPNPLLLLGGNRQSELTNYKARLEGPWRDQMAPKVRADLAARRRRLKKRGALVFRIAENEAEADTMFAALLAQRAERCAVLGRTDILAGEAYRAFYRGLVRPGQRQSLGVLQALSVGGEIVATGYGLSHGGSFHLIFPAFKAEGWRNYSPGLQLIEDSMDWACKAGFSAYDFTIGDEPFKRDLGGQAYPLYEHLAALSPRGIPLLAFAYLRHGVRKCDRLRTVASQARDVLRKTRS